ncbi:MAG: FecCD family ABC transporter permease [Mycetocola reblochoni]|uniref:FecCD family ABC transporter permease n=2 Tax=Mycetocola reblochoni TaxID=331618 RepID=UPI003F9E957C
MTGSGAAATSARTATRPGARADRPRRRLLLWSALVLLLVAATAASIAVGTHPLPLDAVASALASPDTAPAADTAIVWGLRLPRTVLGLVTGACLGLAGALAQVHTRNPLADPGLLGVTSSAGLAVVAGMAFLGLTSPVAAVWLALLGGLAAGAVVLVIAARVRAFGQLTTLILTGAVTSALLGALSTAILLTHEPIMRSFQGWSTGSLLDRPLELLPATAPLLVAGLVLTLLNLPAWSSLTLGDALAEGLGRNVAIDRAVGVTAIVLLAAVATAIAGPIAFVGLLSAHLARALARGSAVAGVLLAAPCGAALLLAADVLGRIAAPAGELSVGVAVAVVGAPVFVLLARAATR